MFHLGGVQKWKSWLENENNTSWASMDFTPLAGADKAKKDTSGHDVSIGGVSITAEMLESAIVPLQSNEIGMSPAEKFNVGSAACVRYIDWAVKEVRDGGLAVRNHHRVHWWKVLKQFVESGSGRALIQQSPTPMTS